MVNFFFEYICVLGENSNSFCVLNEKNRQTFKTRNLLKNHGGDSDDYLVVAYITYMYNYITGHEVSYSNRAVVLSFVN